MREILLCTALALIIIYQVIVLYCPAKIIFGFDVGGGCQIWKERLR